MVLKHDGIIMAKDIIEFPEGTNGFDLTDKSEKITDTEIFFDNANDSVVHVEVDGKSYQHEYISPSLMPTEGFEEADKIQWVNRAIEFDIVSDSFFGKVARVVADSTTRGIYQSAKYLEVGSKYTVSLYAKSPDKDFELYIGIDGDRIENAKKITLTPDWKSINVTLESVTEVNRNLRFYGSGEFYLADPKIELGAKATRPLSPDYPIEIHSLNDFDVVSSVGGRNLIIGRENGNVRLSANNRAISPSIYKSYEDYDSVKLTGGHQLSTCSPEFTTFILEKDKEYTVSMYVYSPVKLDLSIKSYYSDVWTTVPANTWTRLDETIIGTGGSHRLPSLYSRNAEALNHEIFYNRIKLEEGRLTPYSPAPEDITGDSNHPLIDKINLSLSEPLRSVGDVKDRIFRDTDGLWKIERNVEEATFDGTEDWRVWYTRDTSGMFGLSREHLEEPMLKTNGLIVSNMFPSINVNSIDDEGMHIGTQPRLRVRVFYERVGTTLDSTDDEKINSFKQWLSNIYTEGVPLTTVYEVESPITETLDQELQDKLNNLRSFEDSNYIYTILDKTDILSDYVVDNLKPTLHARFKSEDYGILNNDYGINYPDKITYLGTYFKHGDLVTQEFIESED